MQEGAILVCQDAEALTCASLRPLQLQNPVPAETLARQVVALLRKVAPQMNAYKAPNSTQERVIMRIEGIFNNTPIEGLFCVEVHGAKAFFSGYQAPTRLIKQLAPTLEYILASYRPEKPLPRERFVEANQSAFTGFAPQGWRVQAIMQRDHQGTPIGEMKATDPTGFNSVEVSGQYQQFTENPMLMFGPARFLAFMPAVEYIKRFVVPQLQPRLRNMRVEQIVARPDLTQKMQAEAMLIGEHTATTSYDAASLQYTYINNGRLYRNKTFVKLTRYRGLGNWMVLFGAKMNAPAEQFEEIEPILQGIADSIKVDPRLTRAEQMRGKQALTQAQQRFFQSQQDYLAALNNAQHVQMDIAQDMVQGQLQRNAEFDRVNYAVGNAIRGTQDMYDPWTGQVYNVDIGAYQYWGDGSRAYGGSFWDSPKLSWHKLEPTGY